MSNYFPTIGLEVHAELKTRTKMFCDSLNDPDEKHPNQNVCPVCLGHPGTLPTINKKAVEEIIKVGLALGGKIQEVTKFDRKNYFYPDLPKGYQISQYDKPLVVGGKLRGVRIHRIHLEEDAGKLLHNVPSTDLEQPVSLVDFNRAGVPLMELVTEPDIHSAEEAVAFMKELQLILRYLGVSDADLERGQMRADANVSLSTDPQRLGTRTEIKNLNSFAAILSAINYEIKRQTEILEKGEVVYQETRRWDDTKKTTIVQRFKERAHDYRYFPEPDLPPFETKIFDLEKLKKELPELPSEKRERFRKEYGLKEKYEDFFINEPKAAEIFEQYVSELKTFLPDSKPTIGTDFIINDLRGFMAETGTDFSDLKVKPEHIAHLEALVVRGVIGNTKVVGREMFETGLDPEDIVKNKGYKFISDDSTLEAMVEEIIKENPGAVGDYKKGKAEVLQFLIGKAMAKSKGQANPEKLKEIFKKAL